MKKIILIFAALLCKFCVLGEYSPTKENWAGIQKSKFDLRFNDLDLSQILDGVTTVKLDGSHGELAVFGENAFPLLGGLTSSNGYLLPLAAGGHYGQGRIIGFGRIDSESVFQINFDGPEGQNFNGQFYSNMYSWLSANMSGSNVALIGPNYSADYVDFMSRTLNYEVTLMSVEEFENLDPPALSPFSILVVNYNFPFSRVDDLLTYVENGGSLLIVADHWRILGDTPEAKDPTFYLNQFAPNHVMSKAGFLCSGEYDQNLQPSSVGSINDYPVSVDMVKSLHFLDFWPLYEEAMVNGNFSNFPTKQQIKIMDILFTFLPRHVADPYFEGVHETAKNFVSTTDFHPNFEDGQPIKNDEDKVKLLLFHYVSTTILKNEDIVMHPGVPFFPNFEYGWPRPPSKNAAKNVKNDFQIEKANLCLHPKRRRIEPSKNVKFQTKKPKDDSKFPGSSVHTSDYIRRWFNTGYYALPGKVVTIQLNSDAVLVNHSVQIGVHTDRWSFEGNGQFERIPNLVLRKYVDNNYVEMASPYGGLILIQVPYETYSQNVGYQPNVTVGGEGAVRAPIFEYGKTSLTEWKNTIRNYPGLWTEFKTETISYLFPTSEAKLIDNPDESLSLWTIIMDAYHDFTRTPKTNGQWRRDMIVMDYSSFAGAAHAGYPTVVPKEWKTNFVNTTDIRDPDESWGLLHEIGHDYQEWDWWAIDGTSETTNNLIVLYIQETIFGHDAALKMEKQELKENIQTFLDNGRTYGEWQSDPWLSLGTYYQLKLLYGWGAYKTVFDKYYTFREEDRPSLGQPQTDLWIVTFSLVVQENLANFFESWGVPLSAEGLAQIQHLPVSTAKMEDLLELF